MIISILGIIAVQGYWIYSAWKNKEKEFSLAVQQSLQVVSKEVQERELSDYISAYEKIIDNKGNPSESKYEDIFLFLDEDKPNNLISYYTYSILEEAYNISPYLDPKLGEIPSEVKDYKSVRNTMIIKKENVFDRTNNLPSSIERIKTVDRINVYNQALRDRFMNYSMNLPIHKRINIDELDQLLTREFNEKDIQTPYEFVIYNEGLSTKIKSNNYEEEQKGYRYSTPILLNEDGNSPYELVVSFPQKDEFVFSSILGIGGLTMFLTVFIVLVSMSALYQIIRQKKISEIKTDFINNMSHEFKTPIATINLALDAISNPKTLGAPDRILQYLGMIREENSRMLSQVENVLRISQLERSNEPIQKEVVDLSDIIHESIAHIRLILDDNKGSIKTYFKAKNTLFWGNESHFTNVVVNLLDNAIKYCETAPKVKIYTENENQNLILRIEDNGIGMSPSTQHKIFEKFYRETSGNIHNVKGHGLGLAYVKKIVDLHKGTISIESKKGKGTQFTITLPQKEKYHS
ncbi:HAMP domain-containing histidine kinase [Flavobacteriaceae bacterium]|nr:HAMP domain-containing histidine kinase [Flavobacteriaceae bacterium]